eukprot:6481924-Amphidinium_carterae.1
MGAKNSPQVWGRTAALLARHHQGMLPSARCRLELWWLWGASPRGTKQNADANSFGLCGVLAAAGRDPSQREATAAKSTDAMQHTVIVVKKSRSLVGKANHLAGIVPVLRLLLSSLWAALHPNKSSTAPRSTVWVKQLRIVD